MASGYYRTVSTTADDTYVLVTLAIFVFGSIV